MIYVKFIRLLKERLELEGDIGGDVSREAAEPLLLRLTRLLQQLGGGRQLKMPLDPRHENIPLRTRK